MCETYGYPIGNINSGVNGFSKMVSPEVKPFTLLPEFIDFYQKEYEQAKKEVKLLGVGSIERAAASIPH